MENLQTGALYLHEGHEDEFGEEEDGMPMDEDHPMWRSERITLNSVGIDIGSSTSHLIFSRLTLRRQGIALSSRFVVVNRAIIHESPILLTPYVDKTTIDTDKLGEFIHESYRQAGSAPKIVRMAAMSFSLGSTMSDDDKEKLSQVLCDALFEVLERGKLSPQVHDLLLTPNIEFKDPILAIMFSGGVSEFVYGYEKRNLGDLGIQFGRRVRERTNGLAGGKIPLRPAEVRIRATVIGASQYTVQVSGNTIYLSHPDLLPLRNLQVVTPEFEQTEAISSREIKTSVDKALQRFDILDGDRAVALAIRWELGPSYPLIRTLAEGLVGAMKEHVDNGQPLVLVFDADIAKLMGNIIVRELLPGAGIISIDGIDLRDFDFVDIGQELPDAKAVPVVIKSLIFRHTEHGRGHTHHHRRY